MARTCPHCGCSDIDEDTGRGDATCMRCGTVLEESIVVAENQFQERAGGTGHTLVGQFVSLERGQAQARAATHGLVSQESREVTFARGRKLIEEAGVVHISESVVRKRLDEFSKTPSSALTIDEFSTIDLEHEEDPPAFRESRRKAREEQLAKEAEMTAKMEKEVVPIEKEVERALEKKRREKFRNTRYAKIVAGDIDDPEVGVAEGNLVRNEIMDSVYRAADGEEERRKEREEEEEKEKDNPSKKKRRRTNAARQSLASSTAIEAMEKIIHENLLGVHTNPLPLTPETMSRREKEIARKNKPLKDPSALREAFKMEPSTLDNETAERLMGVAQEPESKPLSSCLANVKMSPPHVFPNGDLAAPCYEEAASSYEGEGTEQATNSLETTSQEDSVSDNVELFQKTSKDQVLKQLTAIAKEPISSLEERNQETSEDSAAADEGTGIPQKTVVASELSETGEKPPVLLRRGRRPLIKPVLPKTESGIKRAGKISQVNGAAEKVKAFLSILCLSGSVASILRVSGS
ncbi:TFIIB zinc-binding protein [Teladorsagia circumcincta]|uniref:TFIIB zinc-binding protein n=1 Tax=Teladorsagia circumcincta TaxID=45464 RepID=A0A2G9UX31_TELCI|nr:TFIIB zinc-binding protein [Teladorsagia circumcincta]